jgi:hypothetical protein
VVDHLGKPPIRARGWQPWADLIAAAADSYTQIWAGIRDCLNDLDAAALWAVLGGTARRVYGIGGFCQQTADGC